jgi:hypothetical protein
LNYVVSIEIGCGKVAGWLKEKEKEKRFELSI